MASYYEAFGQQVRRLRERRGYTQEELSNRSGIHVSYLSGIERGIRNPSLRSIRRLAKALGLRVGKLFAFEICPPPEEAG